MWRVRNESTGKEQVWYEAQLIENIKTLCDMNKCTLSVHIMALIDAWERMKYINTLKVMRGKDE